MSKCICKLLLISLLIFNFKLVYSADFQAEICRVSNQEEIKSLFERCNNGNVFMFTPSTFGSEQYPIVMISLVCDFEHPIAYTTGGVSCIFTDKRKLEND